jgi:hypothetical protein
MTIEYEDNAKLKVKEYLSAVGDRLRASQSVDAEEVVHDLQEHIQRELQKLPQPVSEPDVGKVLSRLGRPEEIVDEQDMSWWQTTILRLRSGPEDWRLAYLSLGLLLLGPVGLLFSFLLSRAAISLAGEPDPPAKKWLIYPSLIIVYTAIALPLLFWPAFLGGACTNELRHALLRGDGLFDHDGLGTIVLILAGAIFSLAVWWSLLWAVGIMRLEIVHSLFKPFAEVWTRRNFGTITLWMWALTILLGIAGGLLLYLHVM